MSYMSHKIIIKNIFSSIILLSMAGMLLACAGNQVRNDEWQWPLPPEQPRLRYVESLRSSKDVKPESTIDNLKNLVGGVTEQINIIKPYGIAVGNESIYVTDTVQSRVLVFNHKKQSFKIFGAKGPGRLTKPTGIAIDKKGNIFVVDSQDRRLVKYDKDGNYQTAMGGPKILARPVGVAISPVNNRIYVVDTGALESTHHAVSVFDQKGKHLFDFGKRGSGDGDFNFPTNICIGPDGRVYIVDTGNFRVQIFSRDGKYLDQFGTVGTALGSFARPKGIALDSDDHIYVIDAAFNNVQIFDQDKRLLLFAGQMGRGPGEVWLPAGIHIDNKDRIYIADQYNHRVLIWQYLKHVKNETKG